MFYLLVLFVALNQVALRIQNKMQLIIGLEGLSLTQKDIARISSPKVAGVILFARNYQSPDQLKEYTQSIRNLRPDIFISTDHEGGRVQRFKKFFTPLPAPKLLLKHYRINPSQALAFAECTGLIIGLELQLHGVDFSYGPLLDLDFGLSHIIGDRSFGQLPHEVIALAGAVMRGMQSVGMPTIGKHFPGHGGIEADTHTHQALDNRSFSYLWEADIIPFKQLIKFGLKGIMPAHIIYPQIDSLPAGFSKIWLQEILRGQLNFKGAIISDALEMIGATVVGDLYQQLRLAADAGCDFVLLCNDDDAIDAAIKWEESIFTPSFSALHGKYAKEFNSIPENLLQSLELARQRIAQISLLPS